MHFTVEAQERIRQHVHSLPTASRKLLALDATAGNGFDTLFLAQLVGEQGIVIAIDRQPAAIEATRARLEESGLLHRTKLQIGCHSRIEEILGSEETGEPKREIDIGMFNLGYLPLGDKSIITQSATTVRALDQVALRLRADGILSVISYPGHGGGSEEHQAVCDWFRCRGDRFSVEAFRDENNPRSPVLWLAKR
ncbi:hypothetical protein VN12_14440 [Pirellula sp. SH-Sr6A]|uniref:class I SAM-dependent methyltransferase n=1 Tax=Pirellula sp. SH-Sr6A TaxID=1632865 RepID=UPI00078D8615|nr:class I SAM-dependent methyltransferase [Pirellula sp. SH-Sr6A]AMV33322.1 hypothetical protein VN12_14440 [Pirellula sp. SH-Sr6A]